MDVSRIDGLNKIKPEAANRVRTFKRYRPIYVKPELLLVGNSRIEMGLNPAHPDFIPYGKVYNLGTPGISMKEQLYLAQRVVESSNVKAMIISLDFADFLTHPSYQPQKREYYSQSANDKFAALLSLDALVASFNTVINQNEFRSNRLENGFNPAKDYIPIIRNEGQNVLFEQKINSLHQMFNGRRWSMEKSYQNYDSDLMTLVHTLTSWQSMKVKVFAFINPYHQKYYDTIEESQLMEDFNDWRTALKNELSRIVSYCDFTELGLSKSNVRLNEKELKYFWEPAHYKKELGDIMIPRILEGC